MTDYFPSILALLTVNLALSIMNIYLGRKGRGASEPARTVLSAVAGSVGVASGVVSFGVFILIAISIFERLA
jgi:hypothetical protein